MKTTIESNHHRKISNPVSTQDQNRLLIPTNRIRTVDATIRTINITRTTWNVVLWITKKTWKTWKREWKNKATVMLMTRRLDQLKLPKCTKIRSTQVGLPIYFPGTYCLYKQLLLDYKLIYIRHRSRMQWYICELRHSKGYCRQHAGNNHFSKLK